MKLVGVVGEVGAMGVAVENNSAAGGSAVFIQYLSIESGMRAEKV